MREIEFRIRYRDGKWYYGMPISQIKNNSVAFNGFDNSYYDLFADATTLGQYTGLQDKNGTKIFEGDIVNAQYFFENYNPYTLGAFEDEGEITGKIIFDLDGFRIVDKDDEGREVGLSMIEDSEVQVEIIGNIWDNPELLEGKNE